MPGTGCLVSRGQIIYLPMVIGDYVTVGMDVVLSAAPIGNNVQIGARSVALFHKLLKMFSGGIHFVFSFLEAL